MSFLTSPAPVCAFLAAALLAACGPGDTAGPKVLGSTPAADATEVPVGLTEVRLSFDEALAPASVTAEAVQLSPSPTPAPTVSLLEDGRTVRVAFAAELAGLTTYTVTAAASLTDLAGNTLRGEQPDRSHQLRFTTGPTPDRVRPRFLDSTPASGTTSAEPNQPLTLTFDEPLDPATVTAEALQVFDLTSARALSGTIACQASQCTFEAEGGFAPLHLFRVTVAGTLADPAGNLLAEPVTLTFGTRDRRWTELLAQPMAGTSRFSMNRRGDLLEVRYTATEGSRARVTDGVTGATSPWALVPSGGTTPRPVTLAELSDRGSILTVTAVPLRVGTTDRVTVLSAVRPAGAADFEAPAVLGQLTGAGTTITAAAVAEDAQGRVFVVWKGDSSTGFALLAALRDPGTGEWTPVPTTLTSSIVSDQAPVLLPVPGGGMRVLFRVAAVGSQGSLLERVWLPATGWQAERIIATGLLYELKASVSPEQHVFVVFSQQVSAGGSSSLKVARLQSGATEWTPPRTMGTSMYPSLRISRVQALSVDRVALQATTLTTEYVGLANWTTTSLALNTLAESARECFDEEGRLSTIRVQTAGSNATSTHARSTLAGGEPQRVRDLVTVPVASVMATTLVCSPSGRAKFLLETFEAPPGPGSRLRTWDFL